MDERKRPDAGTPVRSLTRELELLEDAFERDDTWNGLGEWRGAVESLRSPQEQRPEPDTVPSLAVYCK
jgi:hypothetical protein